MVINVLPLGTLCSSKKTFLFIKKSKQDKCKSVVWKTEIRDYGKRLQAVTSHSIEGLFKTKRVTSFTYAFLRKSIALQPAKVQRKWNSLLPSSVNDWTTYYIIPFLCTSASTL